MSKVTSETLDAKIKRTGELIERLKQMSKGVNPEPVSLTEAATMLTAKNAPPPTKEELQYIKALIEEQQQVLTKLADLIDRLLNDH